MHRLILLICLCVAVDRCHAQDATLVPELRKRLQGSLPDTTRAMVLGKLCFNLTRTDPDSALYYGQEGLALAQRIKSDRWLGDLQSSLGWLALTKGEVARADSFFDAALATFHRTGRPDHQAVVRSNMGWSAEHKGDRVGALVHFQEALKLAEAGQDSGHVAVILYSIGTTYNKMQEFARAREHFERSLVIERALNERPDKEGICLLGIGNTYRSEGEKQKALAFYAQAEERFIAIGDPYDAAMVAENTGGLYEKDDPAKAALYYHKALKAYHELGSPNDQAYVLISLGNVWLKQGHLDKADSSFTVGATLARQSGDRELVRDYELRLAELASERGDSKGTRAHYERFIALQDSLRSKTTESELMRLRTAFETERAEKDNELLRAKDLESTQRLRARNLQLYGSLLLAVLALGGVVLVWRNLRQKRRHAEVLEGLNSELGEQKARIEEINGLLRLKVLRTQMDPHFIHNCLNAIRALSLKGEHERAEEYLEGFARILRNVLEHSVRDRISLDEEIAFLNDYVRLEQLRLGEDFTWSITADEALLEEEPQVPSLLVQPFVENAIWHGLAPKRGPKQLTVRFMAEGGAVACMVEDNGVGRSG
ncbi:MAG TPA: tetratricopeptide repeat protein, partial [Flavobacteriales bacterium]